MIGSKKTALGQNLIGRKNLKKFILALAALSLVAACEPYKTAKPSDVRFASGGNKGVLGYHPMPVRAFVGRISQKAELTGVPCEVVGSGFRAKVITPAALNVPVYGLKSRAIYVSCVYDGETVDLSLRPLNLTENKAMQNGASAGLLGVVVATAVVASRKDKQHDEYGYANVSMIFKKGQTAE